MNQLTPTQLAYLAGIMDGEGDFGIHLYKRSDTKKRLRQYGLKATARIAQARKSLLTGIASDVGPECVAIGNTGLNRAYHVLRFKHAPLRELIPLLLPYLRLKRRQAEIVLEFLCMPRCTGRNGVGMQEWKRRLRLRYECCKLNTTPQALEKHRKNGTLPHYRRKKARKPFILSNKHNEGSVSH